MILVAFAVAQEDLQMHYKKFVENNSKGKLISTNVLEFVSVIVNHAASLTVFL